MASKIYYEFPESVFFLLFVSVRFFLHFDELESYSECGVKAFPIRFPFEYLIQYSEYFGFSSD